MVFFRVKVEVKVKVVAIKLKALVVTSTFVLKKTRASGRNVSKGPNLLLQAGNTRIFDSIMKSIVYRASNKNETEDKALNLQYSADQ